MGKDVKERGSPESSGMSRRDFFQSVSAGAIAVTAAGKAVADQTIETAAGETTRITLSVNGRLHGVDVEPRWTLLFVIRDKLGLTATKHGCGRGECGACTVLFDGIPRYACMTLAVEAEGVEITTLEGLMDGEELGPVQRAFAEEDALQCGFCTPGQVVAVEGLLRANPDPSLDQIRAGVSGNLCRCGAYQHIFRAARRAAELKREGR